MTQPDGGQPAAQSAEELLGLYQHFTTLLRLGTRAPVRRAHRLDQVPALSDTDVWLLVRLAAHQPLRMGELAAWQSVDRSTMTAQVKHLGRSGLVARAPDPGDGRASVVSLTEVGEQAVASLNEASASMLAEALQDWTASERGELVRWLGAFTRSLERWVLAGATPPSPTPPAPTPPAPTPPPPAPGAPMSTKH